MPFNGTSPVPVKEFAIPFSYYEGYHQEVILFNNALYTFGKLDPKSEFYRFIRSGGTAEGTNVVQDPVA